MLGLRGGGCGLWRGFLDGNREKLNGWLCTGKGLRKALICDLCRLYTIEGQVGGDGGGVHQSFLCSRLAIIGNVRCPGYLIPMLLQPLDHFFPALIPKHMRYNACEGFLQPPFLIYSYRSGRISAKSTPYSETLAYFKC
jgi:hypothetical protein